ncbi:MAG: glucokinase [Pseudomonadota bacterium]
MRVLAGDIGGTHTRLALCELDDGVHILHRARYLNADAAGLADHLQTFLGHLPAPQAACFAVAGPTDGRQVQLTNLPWAIDADALQDRFRIPRVRLVNDFLAVGHGIDAVDAQHLAVLQAGHPVNEAPRIVLGAGTGLGVSLCVWNGRRHIPLPSEGGHIGFAPMDTEQDRLLAFLRAEYKRASVERILSGPGIVALYRFRLREAGRNPLEPATLLHDKLPAAAITRAALDQGEPQAVEAMRLFCRIYGQVAGDLALLGQALGGVFIAGGIAPKILPLLKHAEFLEGFHAKGRFAEWTRGVPVSVVLDEDVGLKGAALAARLA